MYIYIYIYICIYQTIHINPLLYFTVYIQRTLSL